VTQAGKGDPAGVKKNEDDDVDGDVGCGVLGGSKTETDKGEDGTTENPGESVLGCACRTPIKQKPKNAYDSSH